MTADFASACVDREKVVDYLLGSSSLAAIAKARFFAGMGFTVAEWEAFADALRRQAG